MIDKLLGIVAPHHCYSCGISGSILCSSCKYDIIEDSQSGCLLCGKTTPDGICSVCKTAYQKAWYIGERKEVLERLLDDYKFERVYAAASTFAELLDATLPVLPANTVIVPVPTIARHIRQRGYDHTVLIAKRFAALRKLPYSHALDRVGSSHQLGADRKTRIAQAKHAYKLHKPIDATSHYLLIDDIVTTGATMQYASKALVDAGAQNVWVAAIARQPLDKKAQHQSTAEV